VPVYQGRFRVVDRDVVLEDIAQQVAAGARHITFGDPDFFNGPGHSLAVVHALHERFPDVTYDATIKVEHLVRYARYLTTLRETGCLFVTSAVESFDDQVLALLDKGHTRADFHEALRLCRAAGLTLTPTFVPFTPWTTRESYRALLREIVELDLVAAVAPIQLAIRLLIPAGSRLLELPEVLAVAGSFDPQALSFRWEHPDPWMDGLCRRIQRLARDSSEECFRQVWRLAWEEAPPPLPEDLDRLDRAAIPYINEPWYC
jgi:radical SAM superfamily enzyme YgiQ (UPF0313 family)